MDGYHFCGNGTRLAATNRPCRWDKTTWNGSRWNGPPEPLTLNYFLPPGLEAYSDSIAWAWREWEKVCAIKVIDVDDADDADIIYTGRRIDGRSGTLAWAQLPCGVDRTLESRFDSSELWHFDPTKPAPRGKVHCGAVACHEAGHLLGLEHETDPNQISLLDPTYSPSVLTPQQWDIAQAVFRYGPPIKTDKPQPQPNPDAELPIAVQIDGVRYEGTVIEV